MYCPEGTKLAIMCPNGKWTPWKGSIADTDCISCERGKWCNLYDLSQDTTFQDWMASGHGTFVLADIDSALLAIYYGDCSDGYICLEGATSSTPASLASDYGYPCPQGYYCVSGAVIETPCEPGTYNDLT